MENVKNLLKTQNTNLQELVTNLREANTLHVSVLGGPRQANEPADRTELLRASAEVHGEVLHPRPQPARGGVHEVPVLPPDQERPRHRTSSVQRQHLSSDGVIHCPG